MSMTKHDYEFIARAMKENLEAQSDAQRRENFVQAYQSLANQIAMSEKYGNFHIAKFMKRAGLK